MANITFWGYARVIIPIILSILFAIFVLYPITQKEIEDINKFSGATLTCFYDGNKSVNTTYSFGGFQTYKRVRINDTIYGCDSYIITPKGGD